MADEGKAEGKRASLTDESRLEIELVVAQMS